jgi:TPR repeat protein
MRWLLTGIALLWLPVAGSAGFEAFDAAKYSREVTACDRLASHPEDPFRVAPGLEREAIDLPAAIAACEQGVRDDPANPRLRYQLARVYGYAGLGEQAIPHRAAAVAADYPQALFVVGFLHLYGLNQQPQDTCRAAELIHRSALQGRLAGQLGFVHWVLDGTFDGCPVKRDPEEMRGFLAAARARAGGDFYQGLLIDVLGRQLPAGQP